MMTIKEYLDSLKLQEKVVNEKMDQLVQKTKTKKTLSKEESAALEKYMTANIQFKMAMLDMHTLKSVE